MSRLAINGILEGWRVANTDDQELVRRKNEITRGSGQERRGGWGGGSGARMLSECTLSASREHTHTALNIIDHPIMGSSVGEPTPPRTPPTPSPSSTTHDAGCLSPVFRRPRELQQALSGQVCSSYFQLVNIDPCK